MFHLTLMTADRPRVTATLQIAWWLYLSLAFVPLIAMGFVIASLARDMATDTIAVNVLFFASIAFLMLAVPCAMFYRTHLFEPYWHGGAVRPREYLLGMAALWIVLIVGILLSLAGCIWSHTLIPGVLPAIVAFMLFAASWPSGRAMMPHGGDSDDPEFYREPR